MTRAFCLATVLASSLASIGLASESETLPMGAYRALIRDHMKSHSLVGVGIAVIWDDSVWKEGFGYADKENMRAFSPQSTLKIGSVTKPITAMAIVQLSEQKRLGLDEPVLTYLPQLRIKTRQGNLDDITIRSVVQHASGLPNDLFLNAWSESGQYTRTLDYLETEYLAHPPLFVNHYSNIGYCLLGHIILEASGVPYPQFIKQQFLDPTGMTNSGFVDYHNLEQVSRTYSSDGQYRPLKCSRNIPAGGLYSNIDDLTKLVQEMLGIYHGQANRFLTPTALRNMFMKQEKLALCGGNAGGLGWQLYSNNHKELIYFTGSNHVSNAGVFMVPEQKRAVIVLANTVGGLDLVMKAKNLLLQQSGFHPKEPPRPEERRPHETISLGEEQLNEYSGLYMTTRSIITVARNQEELELSAPFGEFKLSPETERRFIPIAEHDGPQSLNGCFIFENVMGKDLLFWQPEGHHKTVLAHRVLPESLSPGWQEKLGSYTIEGYRPEGYDNFYAADLYLSPQNFIQLKLHYDTQDYAYNMLVASDNELIFGGFGETGGETVRFIRETGTNKLVIFGLTFRQVSRAGH